MSRFGKQFKRLWKFNKSKQGSDYEQRDSLRILEVCLNKVRVEVAVDYFTYDFVTVRAPNNINKETCDCCVYVTVN